MASSPPTTVAIHDRVSRNFLALGAGEAISRALAFAGTLYLARVLGADAYGVIALAIGVNLYLAKIADFGIDAAGAREIAAAGGNVRELIGAVTLLRVLVAGALAITAFVVYRLALPEPERTVFILYALTLLPIAAATRWVHVGLETAGAAGVARVIGEAVVLALVILLVGRPADLWIVPVAQIVGELLVSAYLYAAAVRKGAAFRLRWNPGLAFPVFARGGPLLFHVLLGLVIYNSDLIFLRVLRDRAEVGYYAAAYALISFAANLAMAYSMSLLPTLSRLKAGAHAGEERELMGGATARALALTLALAAGGTFVAPQIIALGFGSEYAASAAALQILLWSMPFSTLKLIPWVGLISHEQGHRATGPMAWAVVVNLVLNTVLVPRFGITGAAVATVATEIACWAMMYHQAVSAGVAPVAVRRIWKPVMATACMAGVLLLMPDLHLFAGIAIGAVAFAAALTALGGIRWRRGAPELDL